LSAERTNKGSSTVSASTTSLDTIFCAAIEIGSADSRAEFLDKACGGKTERTPIFSDTDFLL
jgi:hypothetical protein